MTWTSPKTWSGSEVLTSDDMNEQCSGNAEHLYDTCPNTTGWKGGTRFVNQLNQRIESGTVAVSISGTNWGSAQVTFNAAFGSTPRIMVNTTNQWPSLHNAAVSVIGTGGFQMVVGYLSGTTNTGANTHWMAIGA